MIAAIEVKRRMNEADAPFLFGIDYEKERGFFLEHPLSRRDVWWRVGNASNYTAPPPAASPVDFVVTPVAYSLYQSKFDRVQAELHHGNSFLANLTLKTPIATRCTLEEIFARSNSPYALVLPGKFVCFSPETFVTIDRGFIRSYPMKGTIDAAIPHAEQLILADYKERAEHNTIVDFIRSDLSRVATQIAVDRFRYIDRVCTSKGAILQVSSQISGRLLEAPLGDVIWKLLPAGSISGAPKSSTVQLLQRIEGESRGYYAGVFGYYDGTKLDSAVMIRYIEQAEDGTQYFRSGGGITINSDCRSEYEEVLAKVYLPFA
ncbi:MAG: aminodeoxychorismate synthase component I [Bacteroides sp.]